jgi:hypothetical protein
LRAELETVAARVLARNLQMLPAEESVLAAKIRELIVDVEMRVR